MKTVRCITSPMLTLDKHLCVPICVIKGIVAEIIYLVSYNYAARLKYWKAI